MSIYSLIIYKDKIHPNLIGFDLKAPLGEAFFWPNFNLLDQTWQKICGFVSFSTNLINNYIQT